MFELSICDCRLSIERAVRDGGPDSVFDNRQSAIDNQ